MHHQVAHRSRWQILLQGLPMIAVIKRHPYRCLGSGKKQAFASRILTDDIYRSVVRQPVDNLLPRLTSIVRPVNVRIKVVEPEAIDSCIDRIRIEVAGIKLRHLAPGREFWRRNVPPILSSIFGYLDESIVGARPS